jgi:hypothetical protein
VASRNENPACCSRDLRRSASAHKRGAAMIAFNVWDRCDTAATSEPSMNATLPI